ncbi:MAG: chorismate mutase [Hyphomicrobiales bacterium]
MTRRAPQACDSMAQLRAGIDDLDRELIRLLAERSRYIARAVVLKRSAGLPARIETRVNEVMSNALNEAKRHDLDPRMVERLWDTMMDYFIAYEERHLGLQ